MPLVAQSYSRPLGVRLPLRHARSQSSRWRNARGNRPHPSIACQLLLSAFRSRLTPHQFLEWVRGCHYLVRLADATLRGIAQVCFRISKRLLATHFVHRLENAGPAVITSFLPNYWRSARGESYLRAQVVFADSSIAGLFIVAAFFAPMIWHADGEQVQPPLLSFSSA